MSLGLTKTAAQVFDPVNGSGQPRGADMAEARLWGTELERNVLLGAPEATLAAAATVDIGAATSLNILISGGAGPISSFGSSPNKFRWVRWNGVYTVVHNATSLILPTAENIVTAVNELWLCRSDASGNWRVLSIENSPREEDPALPSLLQGRPDSDVLRVAPRVVIVEPWAMAADLQTYKDAAGLDTDIREEDIREFVRAQRRLGAEIIWIKYVEFYGHWFYQPGFALWQDRDASPGNLTNGAMWWTFSARNGQFDMVRTLVDECWLNGMGVVLSAGRTGLVNLMADGQAGAGNYTEPGSYTGAAAITAAAQLTLARDRTRQLVADFEVAFADYDNIVGYSTGHEPGHLPTFLTFAQAITSGAGTHPHIRSYGKELWANPAEMNGLPALNASLATRQAWAADLVATGFNKWIMQDSVGPGYDYDNDRYTFCHGEAIADLPGYFARWNQALRDAGLGMGSILETWRMGQTPPTNLTLGAVSGNNVLVTSVFDVFTSGDEGRYLTGRAAGNARITTFIDAKNVRIDTTVAATGIFAAGAAFASTSLPHPNWSINNGYNDGFAYPADWSSVQEQLDVHGRYSDEICWYSSSRYNFPNDLRIRLPQTQAGFVDFATRSDALFKAIALNSREAKSRTRIMGRRLPNMESFGPFTLTPSVAAGTSANFAIYQPIRKNSRISITAKLSCSRGETVNANINDVTLRLLVGGSASGNTITTGGKNGVFGGTFDARHQIENTTGAQITLGALISWNSAAGTPGTVSVSYDILETSL